MGTVDIRSQWYPYVKVYEGFYDLSQTIDIPRKVMEYILDMPDREYTPIDTNANSRVRLWKYLYYDGARPLDNPLPTPQEKMQVLFNDESPESPPNPEKGYRLFPQYYVKPAQTEAQTRLYVYMGPTYPDSDITVQLSVAFDIWSHYTEEANTKDDVYSRVFGIEQAIIEAFHGIEMAGVGTFYFDRKRNPECRSTPFTDRDSNVGRHLVLGLEIKSETLNGPIPFNGVPFGNGFLR